jgi:hypothetical protein
MGVWSSQLLAGLGWQAPVRIDAASGYASVPHSALAPGNIGVALFAVQDAAGGSSLAITQLSPATD